MVSSVTITKRGDQRLRNGHPWIYKSDIGRVEAAGGEIVAVIDSRGQRVGHALFSDRSEIALRLFSRGPEPPTLDTWRDRLRQAMAFRTALAIDATAFRVVHGEADLLPSLIVDRYGDYLVVQALSQATDRLLPELTRLLVETAAPAGVLARNDPRVRLLEGLEQRVDVLHGTVPDLVEVREGRVSYEVGSLPRPEDRAVPRSARESRRRPRDTRADACSMRSATTAASRWRWRRRARRCWRSTSPKTAVARIRENARAQRPDQRRSAGDERVRRAARARAPRRAFDTIVLDPPAFAKNKAALPKALSGYKEINLRALKLLRPGGFLITCSCSYNVSEAGFAEVLAPAALDAHADVAVVEKRMQGRDHPVLMTVPETYYLKCFILRKLG